VTFQADYDEIKL